MVAKDDSGKSITVPGLIIQDKQGMRRFARSKERKLSAYDRDSKYQSKKFKVDDYKEYLEGENLKMDLD
jgi:hypothetical protein